jgi:hypothetical protein
MKKRIASISALVVLTLLMFIAPALAAEPAAPAGEQKRTLWQTIAQGGWVMVPIAVCSIATLYLIGDGIIRTSP